MFRFKHEPSSGSYNQCLAKITSLVQLCVSVQTWCACSCSTVRVGTDVVCVYTHITSVPTRTVEQDL